MVSVDDL